MHQAPQTPEIFTREAHEKLQVGSALLVDVREPWEYEEVHVSGARLIPLGEFTRRYGELPHDQDLLIICHSGYRSGQATNFLQRHGYPRASNVVGGMEEWEEAGLPVERGK
ncbi:MAG TPA: rhodanese-like domain-containing protein [Ktedonobacterales bacterium]|jgi:rhodanese-related sulfurtransferase